MIKLHDKMELQVKQRGNLMKRDELYYEHCSEKMSVFMN